VLLAGAVVGCAESPPNPAAENAAKTWRAETDSGEAALRRNELFEAEKCFEAAVGEAENFGPDDPRLARLGDARRELGKYEEAEILLRRTLVLDGKRLGANGLQYTRDSLDLPRGCGLTGKHGEADALYVGAQAIVARKFAPHDRLAGIRLFGLTARRSVLSVAGSIGRIGRRSERNFVNVTVEQLAPCKKLVRVEIEPAKVEEVFDEIIKEYQREARLPGFRPGKAPKEMIAKRFETEIQDEVKRKLITDAYRKAMAEQKITVVVTPDIEEIQFARGQPMQFAATVETAPEFQLPEYRGLPARRETGGVTAEDVERALGMMRERQATFLTVEREVKKGDIAVVNYSATCEGKPLTDFAPTARGLTEKKAFWIETEKDSFLPGFSAQLAGAKAGGKRSVNIDFPADFMAEVKEKVLPEMDQKFAESWGAKDLEALREGVRSDLQNEWNQTQSRKMRQQVTHALLQTIQCELPETMVTEETRSVVYNIVSENQQRGISKEALDAQKDSIYAGASQVAKERVKAQFVFQKIAEKEGVRVEQMEIAGRLQAMAAEYNMTVDKLFKELEKNNRLGDVHTQIRDDKVINLLVQYAKIEDVPAAAKA
jgi:trigger factor